MVTVVILAKLVCLFSVVHMKSTGFEVISEHDCMELHYKYAEEKK
jgi:hypothetical protein